VHERDNIEDRLSKSRPTPILRRATSKIARLVRERFSLTLDELAGDKRSQNIVYPANSARGVVHRHGRVARLIREDRAVYNLVQELTGRVKQVR
jgi:hypothetical protein